MARGAGRVLDSVRFQALVIGLIVLNAVTIGLETYEGVERRWGAELYLLDRVLLAAFTAELALRVVAAGGDPRRFLRSGWNVFDLVAVGASYLPGLGANSSALRLVRLLRVTRLLRLMPDIRVLVDGLRRALPPAASLLALTALLLYLYGVVGWSLFGREDPARWGDVGESMLTLFTLLTLEGWNEVLADARENSPWGLPFILSFILVGTFVVLNLVIGVVITSLDEAYSAQRRSAGEGDDVAASIDAVRTALDDLERRMTGVPGDVRTFGGG